MRAVLGSGPDRAGGEARLAAVSTFVLAAGLVSGLAGALAGELTMAVVGAGMAGAAALLILAAGWIHGLVPLALALPLPALYASESLRVGGAVVATALVLGGWILWRVPHPSPLPWSRLPRRSLIALAVATAVSVAFAGRPALAVREMVSLGLLLTLLVAATDLLEGRPDRRRALALALAVAAGAAGAAAVPEALGLLPGRFPLGSGGLQRAAGGFAWPNELAMFLAVGLPFAVYAFQTSPRGAVRWLWAGTVAATGLGLLATFSRGSWLAVLLAPGVFVLLGERRRWMWVWGGTLILAVTVDLVTGGVIRERILASFQDTSAVQRVALMGAGVLMFLQSPVVGVGPGNFGEALETVGLRVPGLWDFVGSAHNAYIHMAAETGLLGLAAFLGFLGAAGWALYRRARDVVLDPGTSEAWLRRTVLWAFATLCVLGLFEWILAQGVGQLLVLVVALGVAVPLRTRRAS